MVPSLRGLAAVVLRSLSSTPRVRAAGEPGQDSTAQWVLARYTRSSQVWTLQLKCRALQQDPFPLLCEWQGLQGCLDVPLWVSSQPATNRSSLNPLPLSQGTTSPAAQPHTPNQPEGELSHRKRRYRPRPLSWDRDHTQADGQTRLRFICTNATGGPQPRGTPVLLSSHRQTEASTVEPSQGPGHLWEPETEPELEPELRLHLQPGAWFGPWPWPLAGRAGDPWRCGHEHVSRAWGEQCKQVD